MSSLHFLELSVNCDDQNLKKWSSHVIGAYSVFKWNNKHCILTRRSLLFGGSSLRIYAFLISSWKMALVACHWAHQNIPAFLGLQKRTPRTHAHTNLKFMSFYSNTEVGILINYATFLPGLDFFFWVLCHKAAKAVCKSPRLAEGAEGISHTCYLGHLPTALAGRQVGRWDDHRQGGKPDGREAGTASVEARKSHLQSYSWGTHVFLVTSLCVAIHSGFNPTRLDPFPALKSQCCWGGRILCFSLCRSYCNQRDDETYM